MDLPNLQILADIDIAFALLTVVEDTSITSERPLEATRDLHTAPYDGIPPILQREKSWSKVQ